MSSRIHFTTTRLIVLRSVGVLASNRGISLRSTRPLTFKPLGLWYSIEGNGDGWSDWVRGEELDWLKGAHRYRLTIDRSSVLVLEDVDDIELFQRQYYDAERPLDWINWRDVMKDFAGIEIPRHLWESRLVWPTWYSAWDCAGGCVWDSRAVTGWRYDGREAA